jgi:hypothetical protein
VDVYKLLFHLLETVFIIVGTISLFLFWTQTIFLETELIPTVLNGLISSTGFSVGFTATLIGLGLKKELFKLQTCRRRFAITLFLLVVPVVTMFLSYGALVLGDYYKAFRWAITGLIVALCTVLDFVGFLTLVIT